MDFGLSEEQRFLQDTLRRFLAERLPPERVRALAEEGTEPEGLWPGLAELGVTGVLVPEAEGGAGLALLDAAVAAETLGAAAAPVPFLSSGVMAPVALGVGGTPSQRKAWLPRLAAGASRLGVAATERLARREGAGVRCESGALAGRALFVLDTEAAEAFLVAVEPEGLALVPRDAAGLARLPLSTVDRTRGVGELELAGVRGFEWLGGAPEAARSAEARMLDAGRVAVAADLLGASERALELAVAYAKERRQFGRSVGSFQAVKHLCAEMAAELEPARSLLWYAAHAFDAFPGDAPLAAAHAKAHLADVARFVLRSATEVHGGYGFTAECEIQLHFKRVALGRPLLGTPEAERERAARLQGWARAG